MALDHLGAGDHRRDLLLLLDLPVDERLDVGMVDVDHHHLGGAARRAARLDRAGGAVADLEEAHQAGRAAAARQLLVLAAQPREIGAGAGAVFEQARLAHPQVHDAALVDEVVGDRLDEAGVRLRVLVGRLGLGQLAALVVDVIVALPRPIDAVGPVQAGVEPLRRIGRGHLPRQHEARLVEIGLGVFFACRNSRPSSPNRSRRRRAGRTPAWPRSPSRSARPWAAPRAPRRRRPSATGTTARRSPRRASAAPARRPCGNTSAPARRRRPGSSRPALRACRARTPPNRRGCGSRSWSSRTRFRA